MKPQRYCHTIRFRGSAHPQSRYQLQISEITSSGQLRYRAQWDFPTLKALTIFLNKYFPNSQASTSTQLPSLSFDQVLSVLRTDELKVA